MKSIRILIADDHELVRQGMRSILQSEPGWVVCGEASTARQTIAMTLELQPDMLVLDLALPEMDGVEVTRRVRRVLPVPILIVTMHLSDQAVQDAIDAGANGYVLKADAARTLPDAVRAILSRGEFLSESVRAGAGVRFAERDAGRLLRSEPLTPREREILRLLAEGHDNWDIASELSISPKTAETHRARIMAKLQMHSITELVRYAVRNHIIKP